jgi:hypothetical protein
MIVRGIGLVAPVLTWPCSAVGQTTFFAGGAGALVCDSTKPLDTYKTVNKDAEARGRYLSSEAVANCQLMPKNRTLEPFDPKAAFVSPTEVVRLHEKGDRKSVYHLAPLTAVSNLSGAKAGMLWMRPIPCAAYHTEKLNNASGLGASTISTKS